MLWDLLDGKRLSNRRTEWCRLPRRYTLRPDDSTHGSAIRTAPRSWLEDAPALRPQQLVERHKYVKDSSFEKAATVRGPEEETMFIEFVRKMLRWDPESRSSAGAH
ncbi:hypothetical protein VUR80DRAFT_2452 [Thermomyces stellatus]